MSHGHWSGDLDPTEGPPTGLRAALVMTWRDVRPHIRPELAKAVQRLAYRIDPTMAGVVERPDGELEIRVRGITVGRITSGSVGGVRYGREPGR